VDLPIHTETKVNSNLLNQIHPSVQWEGKQKQMGDYSMNNDNHHRHPISAAEHNHIAHLQELLADPKN
jgi:hypothetical protein